MTEKEQSNAIAELEGLCVFEGTDIRETRDGTTSEFCVQCGEPFGYHEQPDYLKSRDAIIPVIAKQDATIRIWFIENSDIFYSARQLAGMLLRATRKWKGKETI